MREPIPNTIGADECHNAKFGTDIVWRSGVVVYGVCVVEECTVVLCECIVVVVYIDIYYVI
jgi:hypothetical protein